MKCLLVFLAFGLVASDKLDRTYLPPPGAKYSGGNLDDLYPPLEYINEPSAITTQNTFKTDIVEDKDVNGNLKYEDLTNELSTHQNDYSTLISPYGLNQGSSISDVRYDLSTPKLTTDSTLYDNFSPKYPYLSFLPNEQSTIDTQSYGITDTSLAFEKTTEKVTPISELKDNGYYYYVPVKHYPITNIEKKRLNQIQNEHFLNPGYKKNPNQGNDSYFLGNVLNSPPQTAPVGDNISNYQHLDSAFGYYGGNPMIMTFPQSARQDFENTQLAPRFSNNENNVPAPTTHQNQKIEETTARSFQIPSVRAKSQNTSVNMARPIMKKLPQLSIAGRRSFPKDTFSATEQRNHIPLRQKFRPQRPQAESEKNAVIVNYENTISPNGYSYSYDTSNGIHAYESASTGDGVRAQGFYSYTGDDGKVYTVTYTADENGFQPRGDHLPSPLPVPETFKKDVKQSAADKATEIADDGSYNEQKYGHMNYEGPIGQYLSSKKSRVGAVESTKTRRPFLHTIRENNIALKSKISQENINSQFKKQYLPNIDQNQGKSRLELKQEEEKRKKEPEPSYNRSTYSTNVDNSINKVNKNYKPNIGSRLKENYPIIEQKYPQTRRPITSVTDNQTTKKETSTLSQAQNPNLQNQYKYFNSDINTDLQDGFRDNKIPIPGAGITFTDKGYYYVPPLIKFNPKSEKSAYEKPWYDVYNNITSNITEVNKRNDFDTRRAYANLPKEMNMTHSPTGNITLSTGSTRKPYISGPNDQDKADYYQKQISTPAEINSRDGTFSKNLDSSLHTLYTTPMPSQIIQELESITDYAQYYQPNNNPTVFDVTSPNTVFNRVETFTRKPGITVSQDFVTSTSSPIFKDGVLEVNQNVKIYGLGKSESIESGTGNPDQTFAYNKNLFYPTTVTNKELQITLTDGLNTGIVEDKGAAQAIPDQDLTNNNNDYFKTTVLDNVSSTVIPNMDTNSETESNGYVFRIPDIPFIFENSNPAPDQENSSVTTKIEDLKERVTGEDFSGPK